MDSSIEVLQRTTQGIAAKLLAELDAAYSTRELETPVKQLRDDLFAELQSERSNALRALIQIGRESGFLAVSKLKSMTTGIAHKVPIVPGMSGTRPR